MCLAQGHNAVTPMSLVPAAPRSQVKHSTSEPLHQRIIEEDPNLKYHRYIYQDVSHSFMM